VECGGFWPQVEKCYEISSAFCKSEVKDEAKLQQLSSLLNDLDAGETIVVASSFSHMLNLGNLAEEVQIANRRPTTRKGNIGDENSALTESDLDQTFQRLVKQLHKTPDEIFAALKDQTVDLVFTAHPTQSVRRSLLQKHSR
jgi:phosphoenolpyruvate carboxylase